MNEEFEKKSRQPDLQQESDRQNRYWKKNYLWTLLVLAVVVAIGLFQGASGFTVAPGDDALVITMPEGEAVVVPYEDVESVTMEEAPDYGECLQGSSSGWNAVRHVEKQPLGRIYALRQGGE